MEFAAAQLLMCVDESAAAVDTRQMQPVILRKYVSARRSGNALQDEDEEEERRLRCLIFDQQ
jgi:hypothetical protein